MGTNYYYHEPDTNHCSCCGRYDAGEVTHIGKSSGGWCFGLHITESIRSLEDWKAKFSEGGIIRDEYGQEHTPEEMIRIITVRSRPDPVKISPIDPWYKSLDEFLMRNNAELGPKNLLRHKIGPYCFGHGEGTWDLIEGEFS